VDSAGMGRSTICGLGGALRGLRVGYGVDSKCYFSLAVRLELLVPSIVRY
jgi:hypothetical protein